MEIKKDYDLTTHNTFGVFARAKFFCEVESEDELQELLSTPEFKGSDKMFLGGGSNVLFTKDFDGIVVLNKLKGIEILEESSEDVVIKSMSGVAWHDLVLFAVERKYWGIENLSYVPGTVGAAPMQNIGAYGGELKNVLENVEAIDIASGVKKVFGRDECELGYRDSIFKNVIKGKYFITAVTIRLSKTEKKNISYKVLREHLEQNKIEVREPKDISDAVTYIRQTKLPDPKVLGNAGSFFKNVFVEERKFQELLKQHPDMPYFTEGGVVKIPSGWLVEQCGWKGKKLGNAGVHERQALVLVNHGGASGQEIKALADEVIDAVYQKFGLKLAPEVNLI